MQKIVSLGIFLALTLSVTPPLAADEASETLSTFYALSKVPPEEAAAFTPLTDDQLASVKGASGVIASILGLLGLSDVPVECTAAGCVSAHTMVKCTAAGCVSAHTMVKCTAAGCVSAHTDIEQRNVYMGGAEGTQRTVKQKNFSQTVQGGGGHP
jgi:hypothetical protein